jgi:hypothetical protein
MIFYEKKQEEEKKKNEGFYSMSYAAAHYRKSVI